MSALDGRFDWRRVKNVLPDGGGESSAADSPSAAGVAGRTHEVSAVGGAAKPVVPAVPKTDAPNAEAQPPKTETPKTDAPKAEVPKADVPQAVPKSPEANGSAGSPAGDDSYADIYTDGGGVSGDDGFVEKTSTVPSLSESDLERERMKPEIDAIRNKKEEDRTKEERLKLFDYDNPPEPEPQMEKFPEAPVPKEVKNVTEATSNAYRRIMEMKEASGDTPAQRVKRAKAMRAARLVAMLGDALQSAVNIWGASRGATSAKLSSMSEQLSRAEARRQSQELARAKEYARELESARREDAAVSRAISAQQMADFRAAVSQWGKDVDAVKARYTQAMANHRAAESDRRARRRAVEAQYDKEQNAIRAQEDRKEMEATRQKNREKLKQTPGAKAKDMGGPGVSGGDHKKKKVRKVGGNNTRLGNGAGSLQ